jgi:photosystem II stability/assembly factor-like uncharacterized protein
VTEKKLLSHHQLSLNFPARELLRRRFLHVEGKRKFVRRFFCIAHTKRRALAAKASLLVSSLYHARIRREVIRSPDVFTSAPHADAATKYLPRGEIVMKRRTPHNPAHAMKSRLTKKLSQLRKVSTTNRNSRRRSLSMFVCLLIAAAFGWTGTRTSEAAIDARAVWGDLGASERTRGVAEARRKRQPFANVLNFLEQLSPSGATTTAATPQREGSDIEFEEKGKERRDWFLFQRTYPNDAIPARARQLAQGQRRRMRLLKQGNPTANITDTFAWRSIGPRSTIAFYGNQIGQTSGRLNAVSISPANDQLILVGSATGGIWRSTDGGHNFTPVSDNHVDLAIAHIAFAPSNPSIVYASLGDGFNRSLFGTGVLKSTDAGQTWAKINNTSLPEPGIADRIAVDPTNPDRVYLALKVSKNTTTNANTVGGFYLSTDGGVNWSRTISGSVTDFCIRPDSPTTIFAAVVVSGSESVIYRSTSSGATWASAPVYTPPHGGNTADIRIAAAPSDGQRMYIYAGDGTNLSLAASMDGGATWAARSTAGIDPGQFGYNTYLAVYPANPDVVYIGGRDVFRNDAGGTGTWTNYTGSFDGGIDTNGDGVVNGADDPFGYSPETSLIHPDQQSIAFSPTDPLTVYFGNDGGLYKSTDGGVTFTSMNGNLALTQFAGFDVHPSNEQLMYGGSQDNGTQRRSEVDGLNYWREIGNGDGGNVFVDPSRTDRVFATWTRGSILRFLDNGMTPAGANPNHTITRLRPFLTNDSLWGEPSNCTTDNSGSCVRIAFYPPFVSNNFDGTIYFGTWRLFVGQNAGQNWFAPSSNTDLTRGITTNGVDVLSAIGVQKSAWTTSQTIYTGSAQGRVMVSRDGGRTWTQRMTGLPNRSITDIEVDPNNAAIAYLTVSGFGTSHVFRTADYGVTWTDISAGLPNIPANDVELYPFDTNVLYLATDIGVFISRNAGATWDDYSNELPPAVVTKLDTLDTGKLFAATYGRGAYEFDKVACDYTLSSPGAPWNKFGGLNFFDVTAAPASCAYTATSNAAWITIEGGATGTGSGRVSYRVAENTSSAGRTGTITVGDETFTVVQGGNPCPNALTLTPTSANWNEFGGTASFNVTSTAATCDWTAIVSVPWITVTQGAGQGNGQVVYQVAPNNAGTGRRTGTISIGDRTFTVTQEGPTFYTWTGGTLRDNNPNSGDYLWNNAENWSPSGVPGAIDSATINNGDFVELNGVSRTLRRLTLSNGGLANGANTAVIVTPTVSTTWTGGTLQNLTLKVNDGARLDIGGTANGTTITDKHLSSVIIENRGTAAWKGGTPVTAPPPQSKTSATSTSKLRRKASSTITRAT